MDTFLNLISLTSIQNWLILVAVLAFERSIQIPVRMDPMAFVNFLGQRMAIKVLPAKSASSQQHIISGALGAFLIIVPFLVILVIFREFVYYPQLFDALLLYISIQFSRNSARFLQVRKALLLEKKTLARELLQPMVLRDTKVLSTIGVSKAAIEAVSLRYYYQLGVTLFWFALLGPFAALSYRCCYELHHSWNTKVVKYRYFGLVVAKICSFLQWLPVRLLAVLAIISGRGFGLFIYLKKHRISRSFRETKGAILLRASHFALNTHLSGALYYGKTKYRRSNYLGRAEPNASFMPMAISILNRVTILYIFVLLLLCVIIQTITLVI
ncbi:cobalamin biosynthesis protein [Glaciecola sp. MH2013]|uniref:cobalamin biosynthesis protein CobD/CbiB n=1 Tax=Glaciecola sp. MH2013 TaxID=2785524 RepID=UPI00189F0713|nr:cobalamin biosynthesis protein [Glaciecola sp. MH2013]MBF7074933.1 cobalamin biosynthesis protein [Glaciecola sp. MH2013]